VSTVAEQGLEHIAQLLAAMPFPAWFHESESKRIRAANAAASAFFERPPAELLRLRMDDIVPPHDLAVMHMIRERLAQQAGRPVAVRHRSTRRRASGEVSEFEINALPVRWASAAGMLCVVVPADGLIASPFADPATELLEARERFAMVADHMRDVFWIRPRHKMHFYYVNAAYERIWGRPVATLYAQPWSWLDAVVPEDRARVKAAMVDAAGSPGWEVEYCISRPDGQVRWVRSRALGVTNRSGEELLVGLAEDITERRLLERQREQREAEQRNAVIREVHHRIKNNLQGVVGLLMRHAAESPAAAPFLREAIGQVRSIATIHGLHARPQMVNVQFCEVVEAVGKAVAETFGAEIAVSVPKERNIVLAESEAVAIALIVNELLTNAVKHRLPVVGGRAISAEVVRENGGACLRVTNPGYLPAQFELTSIPPGATGLSLVQALLPREGARLVLAQRDGMVQAVLTLRAPVIRAPGGDTRK
jgi:PAS domain S-box-containing protein